MEVAADEVLLMEATLPVEEMLLKVTLAEDVLMVEVTADEVLLMEATLPVEVMLVKVTLAEDVLMVVVAADVVEVLPVLVASLKVGKLLTTCEETIELPVEELELKLIAIFW